MKGYLYMQGGATKYDYITPVGRQLASNCGDESEWCSDKMVTITSVTTTYVATYIQKYQYHALVDISWC